jgi:hypothetical protein
MKSAHMMVLTSGLVLGIGCGVPEAPEAAPATAPAAAPAKPSAPALQSDPFYEEGAARFVASALAGQEKEGATYTYTISRPGPDGRPEARQIVLGLTSGPPATGSVTPNSDYTLHWCDRASPTTAVSKSIWCRTCNKSDAEDCARAWAFTTAHNYCDDHLSTAGGAADCAPGNYDGGFCVDTTSEGITSSTQVGSDTACGVWPFRHAEWKVTYNVTGYCGYPCSQAI